MDPLRIDLQLKSAMAAPNIPVHLDGLIADIYVQQNLIDGDIDRDHLIADLPIEKFEDDDNWFYKASMFMPAEPQ